MKEQVEIKTSVSHKNSNGGGTFSHGEMTPIFSTTAEMSECLKARANVQPQTESSKTKRKAEAVRSWQKLPDANVLELPEVD